MSLFCVTLLCAYYTPVNHLKKTPYQYNKGLFKQLSFIHHSQQLFGSLK